MNEVLLSICGLKTYFFTLFGVVKAVDRVNLNVNREEVVGLVGESGSGKSVTAFSIMRLLPPTGKIMEGKILFDGDDLRSKSEGEMRRIRGGKISMCYQDPSTYLNPVMRVGDQIAESIILHQGLSRSKALEKAIESMELVGIQSPSDRSRDYPHQLSDGMKQRVLLAMAISSNPELLIADEPTTSLDVITQAQILELLEDLKKKLGSSILLITHNMGVVATLSNKVAVMYAGEILEYSDARTIFNHPLHPYTKALIESVPRLDVGTTQLRVINGSVPNPFNLPKGCKFHPRCPYAREKCSKERPQLTEVDKGHLVACPLWEQI